MTDDLRGEIVAVTVPKWGLSMEDGAIVEWHVAEGDVVEECDASAVSRKLVASG